VEDHENGAKTDGKIIKETVHLVLDTSEQFTIELPPSNKNDDSKVEAAEFVLLEGKSMNGLLTQHGPFVMNTKSFLYYQQTMI